MKKTLFAIFLALAVLLWLFFTRGESGRPPPPDPFTNAPAATTVPRMATYSDVRRVDTTHEPFKSPAIPSPRREEAATAATSAAPPASPSPLKDSLLRRPDGSFHFFDLSMASKACAAKGMRLPTIRELAVLAKQKGAKGILEKSETREGDEAAGFKRVHWIVGSGVGPGSTDEFYYSPKGYQDEVHLEVGDSKWVGTRDGRGHNLGPLHYVKPGTDPTEGRDPFGNLAYWSSSEAVGHHEEADPGLHSFYLLDMYGEIHDHYRTVLGMARCVRDR